MNRADSMGVSLTEKNMRQNAWFGGLPDAEPGVFTYFFYSMFSKPTFLHGFRKKTAARGTTP
jgi:hypothetical protein